MFLSYHRFSFIISMVSLIIFSSAIADEIEQTKNPFQVNQFTAHGNIFEISGLDHETGQELNVRIAFPYRDVVNIQAGIEKQESVYAELNKFQWNDFDSTLVLLSGDIKVIIDKSPLDIAIERDGEIIFNTLDGIEWVDQDSLRTIGFSSALDSTESVYGFGEKFDGLDQRGKRVDMIISDAYMSVDGGTYKSIPFFLSSKRFGLLVNTGLPVVFHMGDLANDRYTIEVPDSEMNVFVYCNPDPLKVIEQNTAFTGRTPVIPRWSLGTWLSRRRMTGWNNTAYTDADIDMLMREKFPLGIILWEGVRTMFNRDFELGMNDLVDKWHGIGIKTVFWSPTGQVAPKSPEIKEGKPEYFVRRTDSTFAIGGVRMNSVYLDVTNPEAMDWWKENLYAEYLTGQGDRSVPEHKNLDGIKVDFSEMFPRDYDPKLLHKPVKGITNLHAVIFGEEIYNWIQSIKPDGGVIWIRGGGLGLQKAGYCWGGDRGRNFQQLKGTVDASLAISICGVPLIGHDIAGYRGGNDEHDREVYIRGVQYSTFGPSFHDHGSAPAPWEQDPYGWDNYRFYARVRYNLLPYLYHYLIQANENGLPLMRTLFLHYPQDTATKDIDDEYMLGEEMLVAPVLEPGFSRNIYLPNGEWVDFWTYERFEGEQEIDYTCPLNRIPVFIKSNSIVPLALNETMDVGGAFDQSEKELLRLCFMLYDCKDTRFDLREEGKSVSILAKRDKENMILNITKPEQKFGVVLFGDEPGSVTVNDKTVPQVEMSDFISTQQGWTYDQDQHLIKIKIHDKRGEKRYSVKVNGGQSKEMVAELSPNAFDKEIPGKPEITTVENWNGMLVVNFNPSEKATGYELKWGTERTRMANKLALGTVNQAIIQNLDNEKPVYISITAVNAWGKSETVLDGPFVPASWRKPIFSLADKQELFIYGGQSVAREIENTDTTRQEFAIDTQSNLNCQLWIKARKNEGHHRYFRWYSMGDVQLEPGINTVGLDVIGKKIEIEKIYITSDPDERPLLKAEKAGKSTETSNEVLPVKRIPVEFK